MSGDIVERLRLLATMYPLLGDVKTRSIEAADAIEQRDAEIERLRAAGDALAATWPEEDRCGCDNKDCRAVAKAFDDWQEARRD